MDAVVIKNNILAYDSTVEEFYENTKKLESPEIIEEFLSLVPKRGFILDIACGPGRDSKIFSDLEYRVIGIDLSPKMIEKAKLVAPQAEFKVMNFLNPAFSDQYFDAVWFNAGLLCVEKKLAGEILKNVYRQLKEDGTLYLSVKEGAGEGFEFDYRYNVEKYYAYYQEDEILKLLESARFKIVKSYKPQMNSSYHTHQWIGVLGQKTG
ncbi:MAG TPA: class I SAM-dependent methyltransferase [Candidatus Nanoarchaeia archaeon]|nr:class I SAM-dependent methyltransferase [Candidatus Nanoarchaeia archaeon]